MTLAAVDSDLPAQVLTYSIVPGGDSGRFTLSPVTHALSFAVAPNFEAPSDANADNIYQLTVEVTDSLGASTQQALSVTVSDTNEKPVIMTPAALSISENSTIVTNLLANDPDLPAQTISWSAVAGADASAFTVTAAGLLSLNLAADYEVPADSNGDNVYQITVRASDGAGQSHTRALSITVNNVNEAPIITSGTTFTVPEAANAVTTLSADDPDGPAETINWTITGGADWSKFTLDGANGALSFTNPPSADLPGDSDGDNIYQLLVQASDTGGLSTTQALSIIVFRGEFRADNHKRPRTSALPKNRLPVINLTATDPDLPAQSLRVGRWT